MSKNKAVKIVEFQNTEEAPKAERDTRAFFERENLTKAEWIKIARVVDLKTINPGEVKSYVVVNAMLADLSKDRRMSLVNFIPFANVLLSDSSDDVVAAATSRADDEHLLYAITNSKCKETKKNIKQYRAIENNLNPLKRSGAFQVALLERYALQGEAYGTVESDFIPLRSVDPAVLGPLLLRMKKSESASAENDENGQIIQAIRNLSSMDDVCAEQIARIIVKKDHRQALLSTLIVMAKSGMIKDSHLVTLIETAGELDAKGFDEFQSELYFSLASMICSEDLRKKALKAIGEGLNKIIAGSLAKVGKGNDYGYNNAYAFLRLDDGAFERLFRSAESLSGVALMSAYETMKSSLIRQATIIKKTEPEDADDDDERCYRQLGLLNGGSRHLSRRYPGESRGADVYTLNLAPEDSKAKSLTLAARTILESEEWQALAIRTLATILDLMDNKDFKRRLLSGGLLQYAIDILKLIGMERKADGEEVDRLMSLLVKCGSSEDSQRGYRLSNSILMNDTASLKLAESSVQDSGDRLTALLHMIRTGDANETFINEHLESLTVNEILKVVRLKSMRLKNATARKVAEGLSVEEFYMMLLDENLSIKMLAYQIAHCFIGKRVDADGNMASVKELVKIVISGGAVGDKELNAHIAMLCDVGADLSTVAMASHVYKMLSLGGDVEISDDDLLEIAKNTENLAGIPNPHAKKLMVSKSKGDKDFFKRLQPVNPKLWSEIKSIQAVSSHSEVASFIKDLIFDRQSSLMDYLKVDEGTLGWYAKNILSLVPPERRKDFFFHTIEKGKEHRYDYYNNRTTHVLSDAKSGIDGLQDDIDVEGTHRSAEMKREFVLSALANALRDGSLEVSPKAIHDFIAAQNKKLKTGNVLLFSVENPHKAYSSVLRTAGMSFAVDEDEYNAKIITTSHDKQEWGDELSFCLGNESFTQRARTGRYFYLGVVKRTKDGKVKKDGVIEICAGDADGEYVQGDAKHAHNRPMGQRLIAKLVEVFNQAVAEVDDGHRRLGA